MAALQLLRRLAVWEVRLLHELEEGYHYVIFAVDRITIGRHRWSLLHTQMDESIFKVIIENDVFTAAEELLVCVGVIQSVLFYTGLNTVGRSTYRILSYDTVVGQLN